MDVTKLNLQPTEQEVLTALLEQAAKKEVAIGLFGSFSVGKSALLNRILQTDDLLPTHTNETTAIPTYIKNGNTLLIEKQLQNDEVSQISKEELQVFVAGEQAASAHKLSITWPGPNWLRDMIFIDTPGRNTKFKHHIEASKQAILYSDAAIYVMPWQGLTLEDIVYLQQIILYQPNIYFVINKIDRIEHSEGVTVAELCEKTAQQLEDQLGRRFPVYAVSAKTGEHIDDFIENCIMAIARKTTELKQARFTHAVTKMLEGVKQRLLNEIYLLELATAEDATKIEDEYQQIELERVALKQKVKEKVSQVSRILQDNHLDLLALIQAELVSLEQGIIHLAQTKAATLPIDTLNLEVQHLLLTTRQRIVTAVGQRLQHLLGEHITFNLTEVKQQQHQLNVTNYDMSDIMMMFEQERATKIQMYQERQQKLIGLADQTIDTEERLQLQEEMDVLQDQLGEQYTPRMIERIEKSSNGATKALQAVGMVGDIALIAALSVVTAGGAAAGKAAAKATTKAATKAAINASRKKIAQEIIEKTAVGVAKKVAGGGEDSTVVTGLKTLDAVTSPIETIAKNIGKAIDGEDRVYMEEDATYREAFYARQSEVENKYNDKLQALKKIERQTQAQTAAQEKARQKMAQLEQQQQQELAALEQKEKQRIEELRVEKRQQEITQQVQSILTKEQEQYTLWIDMELDRALQAVATTFPRLSEEKLNHWQQQLDEVKKLGEHQGELAQQQLAQKQASLAYCATLIEDEVYA